MLDKLKIAVVLLLIGAVSGFLIFTTNDLTKDGIAEKRRLQEIGYYLEIYNLEEGTNIGFSEHELDGVLTSEIEITDESGALLGYIYKGEETNNYGTITVLVGVNLDGTIAKVVIASSTNTPTFVKKIENNYLDPFVAQPTSDVQYDERTGASYTYGSVSKFVREASSYYQANRGDES